MTGGLYIHVPFCVRRCLYCAFYLEPLGTGPIARRLRDHHQVDNGNYVRALEAELAALPGDFRPSTLYFGGGTPTELSLRDLQHLFEAVHRHVDLTGVVEWSCETNPGTLTAEKMDLLKVSGVNRVSLGVQSFDPDTLEFLGRLHSAEEARATCHTLRERGFGNLNIDLMFNVPRTSTASLERDLASITELNPNHVSCYSLEVEPGTGLATLRDKGFIDEVEQDTAAANYTLVRERFRAAGFRHYELFNFARPGFECRHHFNYWNGGAYYGCGPAAHSHIDGRRWENVRDVTRYNQSALSGMPEHAMEEHPDPEAKAREALITVLRQLRGVSREGFRRQTGFDYRELGGEALQRLTGLGMLEDRDDTLRLTDQGLFVSNSVLAELL